MKTDTLILDATPAMADSIRPSKFRGEADVNDWQFGWVAGMPVLPRLVDHLGLAGRSLNVGHPSQLTDDEAADRFTVGISNTVADDASHYAGLGFPEKAQEARELLAAGFAVRLTVCRADDQTKSASVVVNSDGTRAAILRSLS